MKSTASPSRNFGFDNIRGFLIFCVVFGHLMERSVPFSSSDLMYRVIYAFHMPAFIFLFGYFASFDPKRIFRGSIIPYLLFQTLYILFARNVLHTNTSLQYTTPYWLLWYLLAGIGYQLLIPMYDTPSLRGKVLRLVLVFAAALLAGFDRTIGYYASLSRFLVFQPWFLLGYYCRKHEPQLREILHSCKLPLFLASLLGVLASVYFLQVVPVTANMLYSSYSYAQQDYSLLIRAALMVIALLWILFLFGGLSAILRRKLPLLTALGQNTLPVFLLHGFAVRAVPVYAPELLETPLRVLAVTAGILLLLGNPLVGRIFRFLFQPRRKV